MTNGDGKYHNGVVDTEIKHLTDTVNAIWSEVKGMRDEMTSLKVSTAKTSAVTAIITTLGVGVIVAAVAAML